MKLATLCYIYKDNKILMVHRIKKENDMHKDLWNGVGGKLEISESPEDCIRREVLEETGLKILDPKLKAILTFPSQTEAQEDWYVFTFVATKFTGKLLESRDQVEGVLEWVNEEDVLKLPLNQGDKHFMKLLKKPGFYSMKLVYNGRKLMSYETNKY